MDLIALVSLTSPWIWLTAFLLLLVAETFLGNFFFLGGAVASIIVAAFVGYLGPGVSTGHLWIVIGFAAMSWFVSTLLLQRKFGGNNRIEAKGDPNEF